MTVNESVLRLGGQIIVFAIVLLNVLPSTSAISASVKFEVEGEGFHRLEIFSTLL